MTGDFYVSPTKESNNGHTSIFIEEISKGVANRGG